MNDLDVLHASPNITNNDNYDFFDSLEIENLSIMKSFLSNTSNKNTDTAANIDINANNNDIEKLSKYNNHKKNITSNNNKINKDSKSKIRNYKDKVLK